MSCHVTEMCDWSGNSHADKIIILDFSGFFWNIFATFGVETKTNEYFTILVQNLDLFSIPISHV